MSPVLHRRRVPFAGLARETKHALALLEQLKPATSQVATRLQTQVNN